MCIGVYVCIGIGVYKLFSLVHVYTCIEIVPRETARNEV